jgi:hypothetical protein
MGAPEELFSILHSAANRALQVIELGQIYLNASYEVLSFFFTF